MKKKYFAGFLLASTLAVAQQFITGQAARAVFGQQTFTAQDIETPCANGNTINCNNPGPYVLGAAGGVAYANDTLFVADSSRVSAAPVLNRVIIYTGISQYLNKPDQPVHTYSANGFVRCPLCIGTVLTDLNTFTLGGYPPTSSLPGGVFPDYVDYGTTSRSFRTPTAVATNGTILVVADTDNNRVLIWNSIPTQSGQPADLVLGQADFTHVQPVTTNNKSFRGPQGVWIQGTRLFVADTQNNRVMVWNNIPTSNNQAADYVLGASNFTTAPQPDLTKNLIPATASNMLSPVSVTSDGTRLYVTDLGQSRVLIWNTIPTSNGAPADIAVGQPNLTTAVDNNSFTGIAATSSTDTTNKETPTMCTTPVPNGNDPAGNPTYPDRCAYTLSFPRFALSDGQRLFIADGGNDRILVFNSIPTQSGQKADEIIGQPDDVSDIVTDSTDTFRPDANIGRSSADTIRTPSSLAWDGTNLYATDPYDRRVLVYTPGTPLVSTTGIVNAFSINVNAVGTVDVAGTITAGDQLTVSIGAAGTQACPPMPAGSTSSSSTTTTTQPCAVNYTYTVTKDDTIETIVKALVNLINTQGGGDPNVLAIANTAFDEIVLSSRLIGNAGNSIVLGVSTVGNGSTSTTANAATVTLTASGSFLSGGGQAGEIAPGTLVTIFAADGQTLADQKVSADMTAQSLPTTLGGVTVYFDGMAVPISYVSPTQINVQMPFEVLDTSSVSAYVRIQHADGSISYSNAIGIPIVTENPGILAYAGSEPRPAMAFHATSNAIAVVDLEGTIQAGDTATVTIDNRSYSYTVQSSDPSLDTIRDALVALINADPDVRVTATAAGQFDRIVLTAKVPGPDGNGIPVTVNQSSTVSTGALVTLTALQSQTCCASVAGAPVTVDNPATPGELITIYATGLGVVMPDEAKNSASTGAKYPINGPPNTPNAPVDNAQVGGRTANVLFSGLKPGMIGVYEVKLQLDPGIATNLQTQMFIAQDVFTSNIVTIPVVAPTPPSQ